MKELSGGGQFNRHGFADFLKERFSGNFLEIGPFNRPLMAGPNVKYFDLMSQEDLMRRAELEGLEQSSVPFIDFHHKSGDLTVINECFSLVVSSHVLEHQPDLVRHLQSVSSLLSDGGHYAFVIPDSRYCFDHFIYPSNLVSVVKEYEEKRVKPDIWNVIEHRALTCHNDPVQHWANNSGPSFMNLSERWVAAQKEFEELEDSYIDVHCWQFTPESLERVLKGLRELKLIQLDIVDIFQTLKNDLEFFVLLKKQ